MLRRDRAGRAGAVLLVRALQRAVAIAPGQSRRAVHRSVAQLGDGRDGPGPFVAARTPRSARIADKVDLRFSYDFSRARARYDYITGPVADRTLPEEVGRPDDAADADRAAADA